MADIGRFSECQLVLQALARRFARSEHDAEDAVQDVWVDLLVRRDAEILHPSSYLRVAVKHAAQRRAERERNRAHREWEAARSESQPSFPESVDRKWLLESLVSQVEALRPPYREVIRSRYLEALSIREVARSLGRPQATVRVQLKRGLDHLRERFKRSEVSEESRGTPIFGGLIAFLFGGARVRPTGSSRWAARIACVTLGVTSTLLATGIPSGGDRGEGPRAASPVGARTVSRVSTVAFHGRERVPSFSSQAKAPESVEIFADEAGSDSQSSYSVQGVVWDRRGQPVPGADIRLSAAGDFERSWIAGRSDALGRYRVEAGEARLCIWAEKDRWAPTRKVVVNPKSGKSTARDLHLRAIAGKIEGVVRTPDGHPVAGAVVRVDARFEVEARCGLLGRLEEQSVIGHASTDVEGRFELQKQRVTRHRVMVSAEGQVPLVQYVESALSEDVTLDISMPEPSVLGGRVVDPDGAPARGIELRIESAFGLALRRVRTNEYGEFQCADLPPGAFLLRGAQPIVKGGLSLLRHGELHAGVRKDLGRLVLDASSEIRGKALDEASGEPLTEWIVVLEEEHHMRSGRRSASESRKAVTTEDGSFRFPACLRGRYKLRLFEPGWGSSGAQASLVGVTPGSGSVRLVRTAEAIPSAHILGRISGELLELEPCMRLRGDALLAPRPLSVDPLTRTFQVGPLTPGSYVIEACIAEYGTWDAAAFELARGDRRDLGTLPFVATGGLTVHFESSVPACIEDFSMRLQGPHLDFYTLGEERVPGVDKDLAEGRVHFDHLLPGNYILTLRSGCHAERGLAVNIAENDVTEITVLGVECSILYFVVASPRPLHRSEEMCVVVRSEGHLDTVTAPIVREDAESLMRFSLALPAGRHVVEVQTTAGLEGRLAFDPATLESRTAHIVQLKSRRFGG